jgi:subtilisin family serine protease
MRFGLRRSRRAVARVFGLTSLAAVGLLAVGSTVSAQTQPGPDRTAGRDIPAQIAGLKLDTPEATTAATSEFLRPGVGAQAGQVVIRLSAESGATAFAKGRDAASAKNGARAQQDAFIARVQGIDSSARLIARTQIVLNAVFLQVDASKLADIARDPAVVSVNPVGSYKTDLEETVPYIGAEALQDAGTTGKGIKVAVLDTGIDYNHVAFGGAGAAAYAANNPAIIEPGTFPTAKVKGGFDFIGGAWVPGELEKPDPDPLDDGALNPANIGVGHGSHVGHIIGGVGGVAPGVDLYAVKVCSSVSSACSGIALIQAMEFAVDPNGDGNLRDRMHIINMSLGSDYGQPFDDDLSLAVENATSVGILTVAAAGNGSDKPYVSGTPASSESALSVAQTAVPSAFLPLMQILAPANIAGNVPAVFQPWSAPLTAPIQAPVVFAGLGCSVDNPATPEAEDVNSVAPGTSPYAPGSLAGRIVLVDRGVCNFSVKIFNIARGGGLLGIIGLVAPGDPFEGGAGPGVPTAIPGFMISQANSNRLKSGLPNTVVRFDPAVGVPLRGSIVGSSSRGPQHDHTQRIKPEIGAPGASISAVAGSGNGTEPFGGTSGASPMVAGSAALVLEATGGTKTNPRGDKPGNAVGHGLSPLEVKSLLMNNAETNIISNPLTGALTEITRIGGGEVRVNRAANAPVAAWVDDQASAALGFGFVDVDSSVTMKKTVRLQNYAGGAPRTYSITPTFRFADDQSNGAVAVSAPAEVTVRPGQGRTTTFDVTMTIDGSKLRGNFMNSGSGGATPSTLTTNEYDGYLRLQDGSHTINVPWHVLPRKAAKVAPSTPTIDPPAFPASQVVGLNNTGVGTAQVDAYALVATSPDIPTGPIGGQAPTPDLRAVAVNTFPVPAGFCSADPSFLWVFAVNTWERQEHLVPVSHQVILDTDQDGTDDFVVLNRDVTLNSITDGRQLTWAVNVNPDSPDVGAAEAFFFAEHSTNTGNTVLVICGEQIGMNASNFFENVDASVLAQDFYYGGPGDLVEGLTVAPLGERFLGLPTDVPGNTNDADALEVFDFGPLPGNTPELGLMLVTNGDRGAGNRGGATQATEALLLMAT